MIVFHLMPSHVYLPLSLSDAWERKCEHQVPSGMAWPTLPSPSYVAPPLPHPYPHHRTPHHPSQHTGGSGMVNKARASIECEDEHNRMVLYS